MTSLRSIPTRGLVVGIALLGAPMPMHASTDAVRVDEAIADVDPLATSFRMVQVDLRQDVDFDHVYAVPGRDGYLMRRHGGLSAVFDRSQYVPTPFGAVPVIPPNTVFYVGEIPSEDLMGPPAPSDRYGRVDSRVWSRVDAPALGARAGERMIERRNAAKPRRADRAPERADMADERYRRHRLAEIAQRALGNKAD